MQIKFVSMKISIARIFPSNFISHKGVKTNEISQSILISSSLQKKRDLRISEGKVVTLFHHHFLVVFELWINVFEDVYEFHLSLIYEKIHRMIQHPVLSIE